MAEETQNPITPQEFAKKIKAKYPQYANIDDVTLAKKMVEKYPEYSTQVDFAEKKNPNSTSTTQKKSGELVPKNGSLGTAKQKFRLPNDSDVIEMQKQGKLPKESVYSKPKFNEKEVYDLDTKGKVILPSDKQVKKNEDSIIELNKIVGRDSRRATDLELNNFKNSTSLTPQEIEEKKKEVDDEINKNGFWNTAKDYGKKALNVLSSSVARMTDEEGLDKELHISTDPLSDYKQEFINKQKENGVDTSKLSKEDVFSGAKNLLIKDKKDKLKEDKTSLYIDSLSDDEKNALNLTKLFSRENLNEKDKVYLANTEISKQEIENTNSEIKRIVDKFNKKEDLSEVEIEFAKNYEENAKKLAKEYDENYIKYQKNNSELGDVAQEYDLLKRDYDITRKSLATIGGRSAQILYGLATVSNDILNPYEESRIAINDKLAEANSKVNNLLENKYQKNTEGWNGIGDAFEYVVNTISNQLPNLALMAVTGGSSQAIPLLAIGAYSAGNNINDLTQSNNEGKTFYSEDQIRKYAYIEGAGEMLETGTMGNLVRFNKFMKASFNNPQTRELFLKTTKESLANSFKLVGKGLISENAEELGTMWIDIIAKEKFLGVKTSKKEIADLTERTLKDTSTMSLLMSATPQIAHHVMKPITPKSYVKKLDENTKEILRLNNELKKTNLTKEESDIIKKSLDNKISENKKMLENVLDRNKNLDDEQRRKAIELELSTSELRNEATSVKKSKTIDKDVKIKLLKDLETKYKKQEALRENIASGTASILDIVSEEKKEKMKSNALKVLVKEKEGTNEANFTNDVIEKKAIEIYNKEKQTKSIIENAETQTTVTETKPQAKEQEKVAEVEDLIEKEYQENTLEFIIDPKTDGEYLKSIKEKYGLDYFEVEKELEEKYKEDNKGKSFFQKLKDGFTDEDTYDVNSQFKNRLREAISEKIKKSKELEALKTKETPKSQEVPPVVEQTTPDTKEPASEDSPVPSVSDIKERVVYDREPTADDGVYKIIGDQNNIIYRVNPNTGRIQEFSDGFWSNTASNAIARGTARKEGFQKIKDPSINNESTSPTNTSTNGNVRPGNESVEQVGIEEKPTTEVDSSKNIQSANDIRPTEGKTQVDYALEQIDKGILQWSGDINSPRIDLGMSWADIRKGEADLKRGKTDSVPAKRLLDAFENAKKEGGYRYKMGTGSENKRSAEFVTFEDLQRATNEIPLTDSEIEEINKNEEQLAKEYDDYFNSLDEQTQNEILENYEGKSKEVSANSEVGESKNDVSNEEETARSNEFKKAIKNIPESGNIKKYLSGETIAENYGNPENAQEYDAKVLVDLSKHGLEVISKAKELFGEKYIEKTLEFLEDSDLNTFEKAIQYVALMNEMDMRLQADPNNLSDKKLQKLVYAKYQANARIGSLTINVGRLMSIMKYGVDPNRQAEKLLTSKQKEAKLEIEKIIQVTPEQINEFEDSANDEIEKAISEGVEKKINEIYSKLPTSRRIKADKAITALENIQKKLRGKAYDATIGVPIAIIDSSITVIKSAIKAGVNIADAIELGINHIKEKYGKEWTKEDEFRKDMFAGFKAEGVDTSKVEKSIKDTVKELLIEAGFSREVKSKGETKVFFDWKKLAGEEGSVDKIKENVENVLKSKGYSESEIKETSKSFEDEYNRLSEEIINKGLAELENRNLIKPSPNRKLEAKRLAELYNYGLMDSESVKYDNIMNKVLGLSDLDAESYRKIKNATKALADIFNSKRTQGKLTEQAVGTLANQINHQIKVILQTQAFRNGPKRYKIASMASELAGLAQKSLLQNPGNAIENVLSGVYASIVSRGIGKFKKELTPEMRKQNKQNAKIVFDDINSNAGLFYGDTNTSLISESRIEEWLNSKSDNRVYHAILSALNGRMYLEATDSMIKSDITNSYFAKNVIEILTNKSNPEGAMTREEALKYVSDNTTGVKFEEALKEAKRIVDEINSKQEEKQLADSPQAIHRFAMDIVRDNIISGGRMTQEQVEKSYIAGYKSAGRDIGHVANNWVSKSVGFLNSNLQTSLENAVKEKDWNRATLLSLTSIITKNIMNPFVGGGTNWVVRNVTKAGLANPLSIVNIISDYAMKKEIDLSTETGRKNLEEALYRKANLQSTTASALVGTVITMLIFAGLKANDDEGLLTLDQWLKENEWAKKYFDKLSPESATMLIALEDEKLGQHYIKSFGMKTDIFDENLILLKSLDKEDSSTLGIGASIVVSPFTTPGPWRMYRDIQNIKRGLNGIPPIKSDPKITGFWNGVFKGGFVDYLGYRPEAKYGTKEEIEFFRNQEKYSKEFLSTIDEKNAKSKETALKSIQNNIEKLKELKYAKRKGFKIYYNSPTEKIETKDISNEKINKYIEECKKAIKEVENRK